MQPSSENAVVALATVYLHTDQIRNGPLEEFPPPDLLEAARQLGEGRTDPVANYYRRIAIDELRSVAEVATQRVQEAFGPLAPDDAGESICAWEPTGPPVDEADASDPGARHVAFGFRVCRPLDAVLCAVLDPQAWDDSSIFMRKADCVDPQTVAATLPQDDVPEMTSPPAKGSDWTVPGPIPPLFERFEVPLTLGAWQFKQTLAIMPVVAPQQYSFTYGLMDCRWSVLAGFPWTGGTVRNQGRLTASEATIAGQTWTTIDVDKSLRIGRDDFSPVQNDWMTRVSAAMLKAGWREQLVGAVTQCG